MPTKRKKGKKGKKATRHPRRNEWRRPWAQQGPGMNAQKLETILRHYFQFKEFYEATGQDEITLDGGIIVNIHDMLNGIRELPKRQREAIVLLCIYNLKEVEAARMMGLKGRSSPVGLYKKYGLEKLLPLWQD